MLLGQLFKPRAISISDHVEAVKDSKKLTVFFKVESDGESGGAVLWFKGQVFNYKWESFLYPDRENSTKEKKLSILSVSATSKEELRERVDRVLSEAPKELTVSVLSEPLVVAENCKELLALGAQKEGGLR